MKLNRLNNPFVVVTNTQEIIPVASIKHLKPGTILIRDMERKYDLIVLQNKKDHGYAVCEQVNKRKPKRPRY